MNDFNDGHFDLTLLGEGFDASDRELDSLLSELLHDGSVSPGGLSDRVFHASVRLLPTRDVPATPLRLVGAAADRPALRRRVVGRLAIAASVALVCAIGLKVCIPSAAPSTTVASEADWATFEGLEPGYDSVNKLFETDSMTLDDVTSELTMLVRVGESGM